MWNWRIKRLACLKNCWTELTDLPVDSDDTKRNQWHLLFPSNCYSTFKFTIVHVYQLTYRLCLCQYNYISAVYLFSSEHLRLGPFFGHTLKSRTLLVYYVILISVYLCKMVSRFKKSIDGLTLIKINGFLNIALKMCSH